MYALGLGLKVLGLSSMFLESRGLSACNYDGSNVSGSAFGA